MTSKQQQKVQEEFLSISALVPPPGFSEPLSGAFALQLARLQRGHTVALSPQKGPCTLRLRFPLEKAQIGSVWRQRAFLCLPGHDGETQNHHTDADKETSYLVPMSFRAASLNVYPIAGQSFVNLQCFWLPKKHCLKPLFLLP